MKYFMHLYNFCSTHPRARLVHVLFSIWKKTLTLGTFLFQLAYHHEDASSTGRPV
jgi:hypothetical protein